MLQTPEKYVVGQAYKAKVFEIDEEKQIFSLSIGKGWFNGINGASSMCFMTRFDGNLLIGECILEKSKKYRKLEIAFGLVELAFTQYTTSFEFNPSNSCIHHDSPFINNVHIYLQQ